MFPEITLFSSSQKILSNWTLLFNENNTERKYTKMKYSTTKQGIFILITIPFIVLLLSQSITNCKEKNNNSTQHVKKYFLSLIILSIFMLITIVASFVVIIVTKDKEQYYNKLSIYIPFVHMLIFTLLSGCFKMFINSYNMTLEKKYMCLKYVFSIEVWFRLFYDIICCNKFFSVWISSSCVYLLLIILSFIVENINTSDTILSVINFIIIGFMTYLIERREKINFYFFEQNTEILEAYSQFFKSKKFYFAMFSSKTKSCVLNETLNYSIFGKRKHIDDVIKLKPQFEKSFYSYYGDDITDNLIKKYCFGGFSFINPNLPIELRDIMVKISTHSLSSNSVSQGNGIVQKETLSQIIVESIQNLFLYFNTSSNNSRCSNLLNESTHLNYSNNNLNINKSNEMLTKEVVINQNKNGSHVPKENSIYYLGEKLNDKNLRKKHSVFIYEDDKGTNIIYIGISNEFLLSLTQNHDAHNQLEKYALFTSKITHEIKNPLLAIQGEVESLKSSITSQHFNTKRCLSSLNLIIDYSQYMLIVTKDFECVAKELKHINMKSSIDIKPFNLRKAVSFCVELIRRIKRISNIQIIVSIADDVNETIVSDEIRFKQIIINLISNSVKFTRFGSVEIKCDNCSDDYLKVAVIDTGFGIKEEELKKINSNEDNADNKDNQFIFLKTMKNNEYGSGLGLSIVKSLVNALGKDFKVKSEYNKGTNISFKIHKHTDSGYTQTNIQESLISKNKTKKNFLLNKYNYTHNINDNLKNVNSFDKNQSEYKQMKSLIEIMEHNSLRKGNTHSLSQTLVRNKGLFKKISKCKIAYNNYIFNII